MLNELFLTLIILVLVVVILLLSISYFKLIKKTTYLPDKDKEIIDFTIEMYIKYAKDLDIQSEEQHDLLVKELNRIKEKHLKTD